MGSVIAPRKGQFEFPFRQSVQRYDGPGEHQHHFINVGKRRVPGTRPARHDGDGVQQQTAAGEQHGARQQLRLPQGDGRAIQHRRAKISY